jgi:NADP-dependent 3-hydroxy acid dehydrogenase YdfG
MTSATSGIAVITGASAGVGRATARRLAEAGYDIALLARGEEGLSAAALEVESVGRRALPISVDVADADAVFAAADRIEQDLGPIDVWVNNAMATVFSRVSDVSPSEYRRVTDVTYLGTVHGTQAALRHMKPRNSGAIVQVGSALAYRSIPLQSAYCAAKHAVVGFTDSLRTELIHERSAIRLRVVHLPALNTPQFRWSRSHMHRLPQPVPPIFQPDVAARAVQLAIDSRRRELWVAYPTVLTILGQRVAPGLIDRYLGMTGFESQLTEHPDPGDRPDNLESPVEGDFGAQGVFDDRSRNSSWALEMSARLPTIAGLTAVGLVGASIAVWRR